MLWTRVRATLAAEGASETMSLKTSPEDLRTSVGASVVGPERETWDLTSEGGARETWLVASKGTMIMALEDTVVLASLSLSSDKLGRKTASIEFPSKSMIAAE
jgi:hypothetical protein